MKIRKKRKFLLYPVCMFIIVSMLSSGCSLVTSSEDDLEEDKQKDISKQEQSKEPEEGETIEEQVEATVAMMTLEEKAAQLFMITPEQLTGVETVIQAGETTRKCLSDYPVGGIVYLKQNLKDAAQTKEMLEHTKQYAKYPLFLGLDEEGGPSVARIGNNEGFSVEQFPAMKTIGESGDTQEAYRVGETIGGYLSELGFNMDFAPVADVLSNPENQVIGSRSFGPDPQVDAQMVTQVMRGLEEKGVLAVLKHFPGHGNTAGDSHETAVVNDRTLEELTETEFVPFQAGIDQGAQCVMVGHISLPQVTGENIPATLSSKVVTDILRGQLGFDGLVITDAMDMGAIKNYYASGEAAVMAIEAGCDILLMPEDFKEAYQGILGAVKDGRLSEERLDESVYRILLCKIKNNI